MDDLTNFVLSLNDNLPPLRNVSEPPLPPLNLNDLDRLKRQLGEHDRMDAIFRMGQNLTEKFDNRAYLHPHGMTDFDYRSISDERKPQLETFKHKTRVDNYRYLSENPEIDALLAIFLRKILQVQPSDVLHFTADFFTRETATSEFMSILEEEKERLSRYRVNKMKKAGKITTIQLDDLLMKHTHDPCKQSANEDEANAQLKKLLSEPSKILEMQEGVLNWLKKLNIGPIAQDIDTREIKVPTPPPKKRPPVKPKKQVYCGCKDPGRREKEHPKKPKDESVAPKVEEAKPKSCSKW